MYYLLTYLLEGSMDYTKQLQDKLNKAYDVISAFQDWFDKHHLFCSDDEQIKTAMDRLLGEV